MTTSPARSARFLLITTVMLAVAGMSLLLLPHGRPAHTAAAPPPQAATSSSLPAPAPRTPAAPPEATRTKAVEVPAQPAAASLLPPHGEGPAGDTAIQQALEAAWPADLPPGDERQLLAAGRALLRADATGIGRAKWPGVFPHSGQGLAPAFGTGRFRIQAAIARRDGADDLAVVHLVWAGTDRGGTFTDGRITDWHFTRTTTSKGAFAWTAQPQT
ncbi:hypothetical protein ACIPSA_48850 [Streptomyces sp. NPDC086549]|uniref:hypothetical protein n=1 Tax=Streptomyces sp. NPDC086549 TaxID=3365752 RepID=UPI0037FC548B